MALGVVSISLKLKPVSNRADIIGEDITDSWNRLFLSEGIDEKMINATTDLPLLARLVRVPLQQVLNEQAGVHSFPGKGNPDDVSMLFQVKNSVLPELAVGGKLTEQQTKDINICKERFESADYATIENSKIIGKMFDRIYQLAQQRRLTYSPPAPTSVVPAVVTAESKRGGPPVETMDERSPLVTEGSKSCCARLKCC